ncbi:MAG: hypothetical protein AB1921_14555 [Thermodesulfobacteriota bacterium]
MENEEMVDLDQAMRQARTLTRDPEPSDEQPPVSVITGHPAEGFTVSAPAEAPRSFPHPALSQGERVPTSAESPQAEGAPEGPRSTPHPALSQGERVQPPASLQPEEPKPEESFRFKDHGAAEQGYRGARQELDRVRRKLADVEKVQKTARDKEAETAAEEQARAKAQEVYANALTAMDEISSEDPDYKAKVANIWARANFDTAMLARPASPADAPEGGKAKQESQPAPGPETPPEEISSPEEVVRLATEKALSSGISQEDLVVFRGFAGAAPEKDAAGNPLDLSAQIGWAVQQTKEFLVGRERRAVANANQPLGRVTPHAPAAPAAADASRTVSIGDALDAAFKARTL